jgi:hypothetical protein
LLADLDEHDLLDGDGTDDEDRWELGAVLEFDMPPSMPLWLDVTFRPPSFVAPPDVKSGRGTGPPREKALVRSLISEMTL